MFTRSFSNICREFLEQGRKYLSMHTGIVAKIMPGRFALLSIASHADVFVQGDAYNIKNTICTHVINSGKTVAIHDFSAAMVGNYHPLYIPGSLKAYIGTPILHQDQVWGILDFTSFSAKGEPFRQDQIRFVEEGSARLTDILNIYLVHKHY